MLEIKFTKLNILYGIIALFLLVVVTIFAFRILPTKNIPATHILSVPFSAQAPTDNWNNNEDCEETSLAMANTFLNGNNKDNISANSAQEAINNLKNWEGKNLGYNADTGANVTTRMGQEALGLKIKQITNFTALDLKTALVNGHPILLPINAKLLESPQYVEDGPTYHMVVIIGFKNDVFVVHDPGTNNGSGNEYTFSTLQKAAADWDNVLKKMDPNKKTALIVSK